MDGGVQGSSLKIGVMASSSPAALRRHFLTVCERGYWISMPIDVLLCEGWDSGSNRSTEEEAIDKCSGCTDSQTDTRNDG